MGVGDKGMTYSFEIDPEITDSRIVSDIFGLGSEMHRFVFQADRLTSLQKSSRAELHRKFVKEEILFFNPHFVPGTAENERLIRLATPYNSVHFKVVPKTEGYLTIFVSFSDSLHISWTYKIELDPVMNKVMTKVIYFESK